MKVLLTGGCGFVGQHTIEHLLKNTDWDIVIMDRLSYAGSLEFLADIDILKQEKDRISFVFHDFRAPLNETVRNKIGDVDYIIHMGAESHVDRSIDDPIPFAYSNVVGTVNMLEYLRHHQPEARFVYIGTDEVYGPAIDGHLHKEGEPHRPSNPYSASKSGAEAFCYAYWNTYGLDIIITNTMNMIGERQNPEKFLPKTVKRLLAGEPMIVHCKKVDGEVVELSSRCWLHSRNLADALIFLYDKGEAGESYNVVGEWADIEMMVKKVAKILGVEPLMVFEDFHSYRPGHDMHYGLDGTKMKELGWEPAMTLDETLEKTIKWMQENPKWLNYGEKVSK